MQQDPKSPKPDEQELTVDDLESVSGGAGADYLLELDGIKGETSARSKVLLTTRTGGHTIKQH